MATGPVVTVNGTDVAVESAGKTVVNIHIGQESSLSYLVNAVAAAGRRWSRPARKSPERLPASAGIRCPGEQKVLGGAQILLGIMCLSLGGVLCLFREGLPVSRSGAPFWTGSLFVVSGFFCVLSERRGGRWVFLATLFNLASVVAGSVGLARDVGHVTPRSPYWFNDLCDRGTVQPWEATQGYPEPVDDWTVRRCKEKMGDLMNISYAIQILLLVCSVAALGIALFCFGYGLCVLCRSLRANSEDYVAIGNPETPPSYKEEPDEEKAAT